MINEQETRNNFFLTVNPHTLMKSGAPPDKLGVLYCMVTYRIPWFHKQNFTILRVITLCPWSYLNFFRDGMGPCLK